VRKRARKRKRMALIRVPEWAMPTQKTKSVIRLPHITGRRRPVRYSPWRTISE
jgi:hypothetical protein